LILSEPAARTKPVPAVNAAAHAVAEVLMKSLRVKMFPAVMDPDFMFPP
jgi:hypothetical protein